jgi:hypothetical protein
MIEQQIQTALAGIAQGGVHFDVTPEDTPKPYITLQQAGGSSIEFLEGISDKDDVRIQIDVFASKRTEANRIMSQVRAIVCAAPLHASQIGAPVSGYEASVRTYRRYCDFRFIADA